MSQCSSIFLVLLSSLLGLADGVDLLSFRRLRNALTASKTCNGRSDLCHLPFDKITLFGSHNSGSYGFGKGTNCLYANHLVKETGQLDHGVRYLDIDSCLRDGVLRNCHGKGGVAKTLRPLRTSLEEVAQWAAEHPRDVIMLSFGDHDPDDDKATKNATKLLVPMLKELFMDTGLAVRTKDVVKSTENNGAHTWPTLGSMLSTGRRVVLAVEGNYDKPSNDWIYAVPNSALDFVFNLNDYFEYTYSDDGNAGTYRKLLTDLKYQCWGGHTKGKGLHLDAFLKPVTLRAGPLEGNELVFFNATRSNIGIDHCFCNECTARNLNDALTRPRGDSKECILERSLRICANASVHVHAVKVDYEEFGQVQEAIRRMNNMNVKRFCPDCTVDSDFRNQKLRSYATGRGAGFFSLMFIGIMLGGVQAN